VDLEELERRAERAQRIAAGVALALAAAAVVSELRKPPAERRWHGRLGGLIPYDFRPPTLDRLLGTWWRPDDPRILVGTAFGLGWDVNVGRLVALLAARGAGVGSLD
jgi:hypothetical protein